MSPRHTTIPLLASRNEYNVGAYGNTPSLRTGIQSCTCQRRGSDQSNLVRPHFPCGLTWSRSQRFRIAIVTRKHLASGITGSRRPRIRSAWRGGSIFLRSRRGRKPLSAWNDYTTMVRPHRHLTSRHYSMRMASLRSSIDQHWISTPKQFCSRQRARS